MSDFKDSNFSDDTILGHAGRNPQKYDGVVNPPVFHASTILAPDLETFDNFHKQKISYGIHGTETTFALEDAICALEKGAGAVLAPSGLAAICVVIMAYAKSGDHVLLIDNTYGPARSFMDKFMADYGVEAEYFPPSVGSDIEKLIKPNTTLIWTETPGSHTFEMTDITAISEVAKSKDIIVAVDNTWSGGYYYKPLEHGADISVQAATKYIVGHSDCLLGTIVCNEKTLKKVRLTWDLLGMNVGPDDVFLAMRGIRTMGTRLRQHYESGMKVANWLKSHPDVLRVLHPALPDDPGHELWKRDFTGASGLFGFVMKQQERPALARMMDDLNLFGMGFSWGGFESLLIPSNPAHYRSATKWDAGGQTMRIHVGLEDPDDLIADLDAGFARLKG